MKRTLRLWLWPFFTAMLIGAGPVTAHSLWTITGPPVAESLVLAVMAEQGFAGEPVCFTLWHSPDQARALIASGKAQASVITTSGAALFFNRGMAARIGGVFDIPLWVVSTGTRPPDPSPETPGHAKASPRLTGTMLFPFGRGEMPGLLFATVMGDLAGRLEIRHTGGALEALNLLLLGRGSHALLAEPAASLAVSGPLKPGRARLFKHLDMRREWEKKFKGRRLFVSALCLFGRGLEDPGRIQKIIRGYARASRWIQSHPKAAARFAQKHLPALGIDKSCGGLTGGALIAGQSEFEDTRFFLEKIFEKDPGAVGGELPGPELFMDVQ